MKKQSLFLGVDGGGTKTHCALFCLESGALDFLEAGPGNHESLPGGFEGLAKALNEMLLPLLARNGVSPADVAAAAFGLGGMDAPIQHEIISGIIRGMGFQNFALANDAFLGIKAECSTGFGIGAVNGSGFSVVGMSESGRSIQIGGNGDWTGDKGGTAFYLPQMISAVYAELYKDGARTALTGKLQTYLGMPPRELYVQSLMLKAMENEDALSLALCTLLYEAANEKDAAARAILEESGRDYALSIRIAARELELPADVEVALIGSHFKRAQSELVLETIRSELKKDTERSYAPRIIRTQPVAGALLWALELAGRGGEAQRERIHELMRKYA
ncbi:MAG: BadF/BadG/BcrA/BcrD ATPase family protein [Clostridiaceae bacterium]|nr:hypothetical protein [Eubacteriales bacterium]